MLPAGWARRLIPEVDPISGATGWCLDPHDLTVAKLIASRPKDIDFVRILIEARLIDPEVVGEALATIEDERAAAALAHLEAMSMHGLGQNDRSAWHRRRRQSLQDRRQRTKESSPAGIIESLVAAGEASTG